MSLLFVNSISKAGSMRKVRIDHVECPVCKRTWFVTAKTNDGNLMLSLNPKAPEKQESKKGKYTRADHVIELWKTLTGQSKPTFIPKNVIEALCVVHDDKQGLVIGADILALAVDQGGRNHVVVVDDPRIASAIRPTLIRTKVEPADWRPAYGDLFAGIMIGRELDTSWLSVIKRSLAPNGNVFLLGPAVKHKDELNAAWGLNAIMIGTGADAYCLMMPHPEKLGEGPGTELSEGIKLMGMPSCQQCYNLAMKMNTWGVEGCRDHIDEILDDIAPRALDWWDHTEWRSLTSAWWKSASSALTVLHQAYKTARPDKVTEQRARLSSMLRVQVRTQVVNAINQYELKTKNK